MQVEITQDKIVVDITKEGGDNTKNMKVKVEKQEEASQEETKTEEAATETKTEEKTETTETKTEEAAAETKTEATEAKTEATEEAAKSEEAETKTEEAAKTVKTDANKAEEVVVKLNFDDFKKDFEKFISPIKEEIATLTKTVATLATSKAPTEGAADAEETHVEKADKVEKTDASKEEENKSDTSSEGASDSKEENAGILKAIADLKTSFEERLKKVEAQPAPSKVVVVQKTDGLTDTDTKDRLTKVNSRLDEIAKYRDTDAANYHRDTKVQDEAFRLISERRELSK